MLGKLTIRIAAVLAVAVPSAGQEVGIPVFVDATDEMGVAIEHRAAVDAMRMGVGSGAAWLDFDQDGDLDLYVTQGVGSNALFRNDGSQFTEIARSYGAADSTHAGSGVAVGDYDNDGWPDLFLANSDRDVLLRNLEGVGFEDVTDAAGFPAAERARGTSAAWGDYDRDGFLDLYVTNHMDMRGLSYSSQDRLYRNNQDGTFADVSDLLGAERLSGYGFIGGWTDFDNDGDVDILLINDCPFGREGRYQPNYLFRNDGGNSPAQWLFTEIADAMGASHCRHGMGLAVGDYNRDGWMDYFFTNIGKKTTLLMNGPESFQDRAADAGVYVGLDPGEPGAPIRGTFTWGANFFDYDRDGWQDLFVSAGTLLLDTESSNDPQPDALFRNEGNGIFADVSAGSGLSSVHKSRTSVYGDYDGDGDLDLFVVSVGQHVRLYRNESAPSNHYLVVELEGTVSNRDGIGSRVVATLSDGSMQHFEVRSGSSLGGGDARAAFFGLGSFDSVTSLEVRWPSGMISSLQNVSANQKLRVIEPRGSVSLERPEQVGAGFLAAYPNPSAGAVTILYRLLQPSHVKLTVHDLLGREVDVLDEGFKPAGMHSTSWGKSDESGAQLSGGVYLIRLVRNHETATVSLVHVGE
ncbi:MAG: FG-GAP-like repeat-containing protein [Rhodothermales bacterium]|nr:FG-GAP-like repeat-containing protein [Rhodothermales bacterium]